MKKLFKYLKPYWLIALMSPLLMIGEVVIDLLQPELMSKIVDIGIFGGDMDYIISTGLKMLGLVVVGGFFGMACSFTATSAAQRFGRDLRVDAYSKVMALSAEQTDKFTTGSLVTRLSNDISMVQEVVSMLLRMLVRAPIFFAGGIVMALSQNVNFGLVLIVSLPIMVLVIVFIMSKATPLFLKVQTKLDRVNSVVRENVGGARVVKAYVREEAENARFADANTDLMQMNIRVQRIMALTNPIIMIIMNLSVCAIIFIGGKEAEAQRMMPGDIMAAITYTTMILSSVMMIGNSFIFISRASASAKRINEVLESSPVICDGGVRTEDCKGKIEFKNVSFSYPGATGRAVLSGIDLTVEPGETVAVIGATGCGKSTLAALIPRFYDPTEGEVLIDGINVKEYDLDALRENIGYVMQKSELFSDTVENNIMWGKADATPEEIREAARIAQADDFVSAMPDGYGTYIAEKGASLSGGQKQRLSIARAMVRKPKILILDDCTSALDLETEARLRKAMRETLADATVVLIAQRIASVRNADRIAVLENGSIIACDKHDNLMQSCAVYRDIYNSQTKGGGEE